MPHVYSIISNAAFSPETVQMMGEVFDRTWASVEPQYDAHPDAEMELARLALAKAVVLFAGLGTTDPETLRRKALRLMQMPSAADADMLLPERSASQRGTANAES